MGSHVEGVEIIHSSGFRIEKSLWLGLAQKWEDQSAEISFFEQDHPEVDGYICPETIWWGGEGSVSFLETLTDHVLPAFEGELDIALTFDGGGLEGYRLRNGKVTAHRVVLKLEDDPL